MTVRKSGQWQAIQQSSRGLLELPVQEGERRPREPPGALARVGPVGADDDQPREAEPHGEVLRLRP